MSDGTSQRVVRRDSRRQRGIHDRRALCEDGVLMRVSSGIDDEAADQTSRHSQSMTVMMGGPSGQGPRSGAERSPYTWRVPASPGSTFSNPRRSHLLHGVLAQEGGPI